LGHPCPVPWMWIASAAVFSAAKQEVVVKEVLLIVWAYLCMQEYEWRCLRVHRCKLPCKDRGYSIGFKFESSSRICKVSSRINRPCKELSDELTNVLIRSKLRGLRQFYSSRKTWKMIASPLTEEVQKRGKETATITPLSCSSSRWFLKQVVGMCSRKQLDRLSFVDAFTCKEHSI
jgi:hypothetical protein